MTLQQFLDDVSSDERTALEAMWQWAAEALADADLAHVREVEKEGRRFPASHAPPFARSPTRPLAHPCTTNDATEGAADA
jgi:hypothetical protein